MILVVHLFGKLTNISNYMKVLKSALIVLLFSHYEVAPFVAQGKVDENEVFPTIQQTLQDWIVKSDVIGGSVFGGGKKGPQEVEVNLNH